MYGWLKKFVEKITEHALTLFHIIQSYIQSGLEACRGEDWGFLNDWWALGQSIGVRNIALLFTDSILHQDHISCIYLLSGFRGAPNHIVNLVAWIGSFQSTWNNSIDFSKPWMAMNDWTCSTRQGEQKSYFLMDYKFMNSNTPWRKYSLWMFFVWVEIPHFPHYHCIYSGWNELRPYLSLMSPAALGPWWIPAEESMFLSEQTQGEITCWIFWVCTVFAPFSWPVLNTQKICNEFSALKLRSHGKNSAVFHSVHSQNERNKFFSLLGTDPVTKKRCIILRVYQTTE